MRAFEDIGAELGVTKQAVYDTYKRASDRLRRRLEAKGIDRKVCLEWLSRRRPGDDAPKAGLGLQDPGGVERRRREGTLYRGGGRGDFKWSSPKGGLGKVDAVPTGVYDPTWSDLDSFGASDSLLKGE